jgi:hypothetical protein
MLAGSLILRENDQIRAAAQALGGEYGRLMQLAQDQLDLAQAQIVERLRALAPFRRFIVENEEPLRRIADKTPTMRWTISYIDFVLAAREPNLDNSASYDEFEWEDQNGWIYRLRPGKRLESPGE